jgi:cell shape-determining protein MreD
MSWISSGNIMVNFSLSRRILNTLAVTFPFIILSFVWSECALAAFYCFIFVMTLSKPWLVSIVSIFMVSAFMDIYNSHVVGISFLQFIVMYIMVIRFRAVLLNCRIWFGICCFFGMVCVLEFLGFLVTIISGNTFNFSIHVMRVFYAVIMCSLHCGISIIKMKSVD